MATIKSFTSLEQSKVLAKILPLESADMYYHPYPNDEDWYDIPNFGKANVKYNQLPCWSLAALLEHLRKIDLFPDIIDAVDCVLMDISFADDEDGKVLHSVHCLRVEGKTILDACVEMIIVLHSKNLL